MNFDICSTNSIKNESNDSMIKDDEINKSNST